MSDLSKKSYEVLQDSINWLLTSDIRIRQGKNKGALYGWKNLNPPSFPFIYSEITGYAITFFSWVASEFGNQQSIAAAEQASDWIERNLDSNLLVARPPVTANESNSLSDLFYSFDNGMIVIGILSLYKMTKEDRLLRLAEKMALGLIDRFFDGQKLLPRLDNSFNPIPHTTEQGLIKWSTVPGAYHCKLSIFLLELSKLTDNQRYRQVSDLLCNYAKSLQKPDGQFITNPRSQIVYLHPHLYACEGLIYSGVEQDNANHYAAGLNGLRWAIRQRSAKNGGLYRDTGEESIEQSDCTAQLLRLLILCKSEIENSFEKSELSNIIENLHVRLLDFHIRIEQGQTAMKYQLAKDTACSWCTMFSTQALKLWKTRECSTRWLNYFV